MATASPMNRGYSGGLAARGATSTRMPAGNPLNRGYSGGLAAGSRPGGGFGSSFSSSFQAAPAARPSAPPVSNAPAAAAAPAFDAAPEPYRPPANMAPDMNQFFGPGALPEPGMQTFNQPPPNPFGPAALPSFGGFRAAGGPVMPGRAYVVGERGPEMIVPQEPGMVIPNQSAIRQSPMNRPYAMDTLTQAQGGAPSQFDQLQGGGFGAGSLANRAAVPVGRSMNDITRIAEMQRRRGNFRPIMQLGMMGQQQNFAREMDARNFDQSRQMMGMQQQAMGARDQMQRGWQMQDWQRDRTEAQRLEDARRQWEMTQQGIRMGEQAMEQERQRQQAELDRKRVPLTGQIPVPGTNYVMPYADGKVMGTLPMPQPAPSPSLMPIPGTNQRVPMLGGDRIPNTPIFEATPNPGWSVKGQPKETLAPVAGKQSKPEVRWQNGEAYQISYDDQGNAQVRRLKIIDANNDGVPDNQQGAGAAAATPGAAWKALGNRDQASTMQTGQMPNVAFANDMPAPTMEEAHQAYLKTGDDSLIRQALISQRQALPPDTSGQGGPRVMTQQEALAALQPRPAPLPMQRPAVPSFFDGRNVGRLRKFAAANPLITIRS